MFNSSILKQKLKNYEKKDYLTEHKNKQKDIKIKKQELLKLTSYRRNNTHKRESSER